MVSIDESTEAANSLPNAKLKIVEDFKHPIGKVDKKILASIIQEFLNH